MKASYPIALVMLCAAVSSFAEELTLHTRKQVDQGNGQFAAEEKTVKWDPRKTAIVICDMWDKHWCKGATERVGEMAPRMNEVVKAARAQGVFVIHAPSDTMKFYEGTPQRKLAQSAPKAEPKVPLQRWCKLDPAKEAPLPIDDSDGGCDDHPQCKSGAPYPWTRQIATIEVAANDAVTDSEEAYFLMQQRGIENVIVMGVHANMCVLGRPFSIRQMVAQGKNVLLMRDMTDTMYNSRMKPFVNHFRGTDLIVNHIEKFWCASITSADFVGGEPFRFKGDEKKKIVFMIGEPEYETSTTVPQFAKSDLSDFENIFVMAADQKKPNDYAGLEKLKNADLLFVSVRRAAISPENMELIRAHLKAGKPMVGIRTASHAFDPNPKIDGRASWPQFDTEILGADYQGHYGKGPAVEIKTTSEGARNGLFNGIATPFKVMSSLYKNKNMFHTATSLATGQRENTPEVEPVAWINSAEGRRVFYTSLGGSEDFQVPQFRALLRNGILWALDFPILSVPTQAQAGVSAPAALDKDQNNPLPPAEALKTFTVADGFLWEQVLAEPIVAQPLQISFDARGRMWVVQYLQYPNPAGLKMVSRDNFWRAVYDKVPPAPPNHFRGKDKITIHEDTDGDGKFDKHKTFVDGLNIATSCAVGRDGVWVLNPPYLLYYADTNHDDQPDGDPVTHLAGFGLEDTHSVANSLRFGPDGWLYGAHGSTVTGNITRPGIDKTPIAQFLGQAIWRYHPETKRFEVFAEGGGNAFGLEMDSKGRAFSGHNGGNTRGFYYPQGAYEQKGFEKHGALSNPYAFGYFKPMAHPDVERFTHTFIIYEAGMLPEKFAGKLFGVEPLQGRIVMSEITPDGATFKTRDIGHAITTTDKWFRPVDIKTGPDGAIYVADWYDRQVNHYRNHEGQVDPSNGRIYRLKSATAVTKKTKAPEQQALETLWATHREGRFTEELARTSLNHTDPYVRAWSVRLLGDKGELSQETILALTKLAEVEPHVEVRSQLACSARRLKAAEDISIISALANHSEDLSDPHIPLNIWWAVEKYPQEFVRAFENPGFWNKPLIKEAVAERLARRFAQSGSRQDLLNCARLFELSPSQEHAKKLERGFEEGVKGRPVAGLPKELLTAMRKAGAQNETLSIRLGDQEAIASALTVVADAKAKKDRRLRLMEALGEIESEKVAASLSDIATRLDDPMITRTALLSLQRQTKGVDTDFIANYLPKFDVDSQLAALNLLASRASSAGLIPQEVRREKFDAKNVPQDIISKLRLHVPEATERIWGPEKRQTTGEMQVEIDRITALLNTGIGTPYEGIKVYSMACGACHKLFGQGGQIGPDLTTYKRDDLANMLLNIVHPNAEIREGYVNYMINTKDGRTLTGFLADEDKQVVTMRGIDGANNTIPRAEIEEMKPTGYSLMPEGLLQALNDQQLRDLFAYLRSTQPLVR